MTLCSCDEQAVILRGYEVQVDMKISAPLCASQCSNKLLLIVPTRLKKLGGLEWS